MQEYFVGQTVIAEAKFRLDGVLTDPAVVRTYVRTPSGTIRELVYPSTDLVRRDVGVYEATVVADEAGTWGFRSTGIGAVEAVVEGVVNVAPSRVL